MRQVALGAGHKYFVITWSDAAKVAQHAVRTRHKFLLSRCSEGDAPSFSEIELRFSFKNLSLEKNFGFIKEPKFFELGVSQFLSADFKISILGFFIPPLPARGLSFRARRDCA